VNILYHHRTQADDGQAVHVRSLIEAFRREGHVVEEAALVSHTGTQESPFSGRSRWGWVAGLPPFLRELAEYGYTPVARKRLMSAAAALDPHFIYERYAFANAAGVQAGRRLGIPVVLEVNSPLVDELRRTRGLSFPGIARKLENSVYGAANLICAVSGAMKDILVQGGVPSEKVLITPNGVNPELYAHGDRDAVCAQARQDLGLSSDDGERGTVLGFVGYFREWHRLDRVVSALADGRLEQVRLVIVGEGPARDSILETARGAGVAERVHLVGARAHHEIPALMTAFDVALMPAINAYASPLKLHEYLAAGCAVVAPDQPNVREVMADGEGGLLVKPDDGLALKESLVRLVADTDLRRRLGAMGPEMIRDQDLTWRANARRVIAAVEGLV